MRKYRLRQITFLDGVAFGTFCTTIIFLVAFLILDLPLKSDAWVGFFGNMIVSGFSIGAAYLALRGNRVQISQTNDIEDERRLNSLIAARAVLPVILAEMSEVARNNLMLRFAAGHTPIGFDIPTPTAFQLLPAAIIPDFKSCIEYADKISQDRLANILRHFQVLQARQTNVEIGVIHPGVAGFTATTHDAISDAIGWAVIYALVADAFAFARGGAIPIPPAVNPERVGGAFVSAGVVLEMYPNVQSLLNLRIESNRLERDWRAGA